MIQYWKKTGGFLEEGEQLNIPNEESSDEEEETSKQKDYLEIGSSTFKGKDAETGDLFELKKRIYRKSTFGPSETLMIHEESENPAEEYEEMSEDEEATREANKDRLIIKALQEIVKATKKKGITEGAMLYLKGSALTWAKSSGVTS